MGQALPQSPHLARTPAIMPKGAAMSFIDTIREDIGTVKTHDPAAQSDFVIFLSYPRPPRQMDAHARALAVEPPGRAAPRAC